MNKPFDPAEVIRAVGIRLEELRRSVSQEQGRVERESSLAVAAVIADLERREALREVRFSQVIAELEARLAAAEAEVAARVAARLAELDRADPAEVAETIRGMIRAAVAEAIPAPVDIAPLTERLAVVEAREMPAPFDPSEIEAKVAALGEAVSAIPELPEMPELPDVPALVAEAVQVAVGALPTPQDGKDADPADLDALRAEIATVKAAIPAPMEMPDLSGLATKADVDAVREAIPVAPDLSDFATKAEIADVRSAIPTLPDPVDLSDYALKSEIPAIPEPKDFAPEIEAVARSVNNALERMAQHPGVFPVVRMWSDEVHYAGSVVSHAGATWQALRDTGREPGGGDWACIAAAGAKGDPGVSMTARGTYDPEADYAALDVVAHDGSSWVAKRSTPGSCPGEGWQLIASRGGRGKPGDAVKGDRGDPGPAVRQATVDAEGVVRLLNADGSLVELDLYPLLSRLK